MTGYKDKTNDVPQSAVQESKPGMAITVDYERYAPLLDDPNLSEAAKREFLQTLWNIILGLIDIGVEIRPVGRERQSCGQESVLADSPPIEPRNVLCSSSRLTGKSFDRAASQDNGDALGVPL